MKRAEKILVEKQVRVEDLLSLLSDDLLDGLARELKSDKWVIKLSTSSIFKLVLYSLLDNERLSLRMMEENYCAPAYKALAPETLGLTTAHSSIRDRLATINVAFFEALHIDVSRLLRQHYLDSQLSRYNIKRYDSTMISVFSHVLEGMKVGNTSKKKNQVKITTELTNDFEVRMRFFKDQDHLGEEVALKELIQSSSHDPNDLIVFDRGLKSRDTFCELEGVKTQFVTRLNDKNRYKVLRPHQPCPTSPIDGLDFIEDSIVYLYKDGNTLVKQEFRVIQVDVIEKGKKIFFVTNILHLPAQFIAQIYRMRWQIEVFFRFIKQEMNLTHFVCNEVNAIKVMLYCTLIAAMMILVYKKKNDIKSYKIAKKRFCEELKATVILELIQSEEGLNIYKKCLQDQINLEKRIKKKEKPIPKNAILSTA
jgi:Transposase DDE domain